MRVSGGCYAEWEQDAMLVKMGQRVLDIIWVSVYRVILSGRKSLWRRMDGKQIFKVDECKKRMLFS